MAIRDVLDARGTLADVEDFAAETDLFLGAEVEAVEEEDQGAMDRMGIPEEEVEERAGGVAVLGREV